MTHWADLELERRQAKIERLQAVVDDYRRAALGWDKTMTELMEKIARLTAVLDAAREHINAHLALPETKRATEVDEDYAYDQGALWMAREILRILDAGRGGERE